MPTIFEHHEVDKYYLKLESDAASNLASIQNNAILLKEDMKFVSPLMSIKFMDGIGEMITSSRLSMDTVYELSIGKDDKDVEICPFKINNTNFTNTEQSSSERIFGDVNMISDKWDSLLTEQKFRSWKQVLYSDIVEEVLSEHGFTDIEVEPTKEKVDVIQPGWVDMRLLRWIAHHATNKDDAAGYQYIFRLDGSVAFMSLHSLKYKTPVKDLYLIGMDYDSNEQFFEFSINNEYGSMIKDGACGYTFSYYDYENKEYKTEEMTFSQLPDRQLSDWSMVHKSHDKPYRFYHGHRDMETPKVVTHRITETSNSIQNIEAKVRGDVSYRAGDLVNVFIKPSEYHKDPINEYYSGYYMIRSVEHKITFDRGNFKTVLHLTREGINSSDESQLAETSTGKDIKD